MRYFLILLFCGLLTGCAGLYQNKHGQLRALTIARNVYVADCKDCDTLIVNSSKSQQSTITTAFKGFFSSVQSIASGLIPRGIPSAKE